MNKIIDLFTGEKKVFEKTFAKLYGKQDCTSRIINMKQGLIKKYLCLIVAVVVAIPTAVVYEKLRQTSLIDVNDGDGGREISVTRPLPGENVVKIPMKLEVLTEDNERVVRNVVIVVRPKEDDEDYDYIVEGFDTDEDSLTVDVESEIKKLLNAINNSDYDEKLVLPTELGSGIMLGWEETHSSRIPLLVMIFLVVGIFLYQGRYAKIKAIEKEARESIIRELPEFINKLVLLLSAGLVLTSAFDRILESYEKRGKERKSYFYSQLLQVSVSMRETNNSMIIGLKEFSGRSGVRELTRVTNIIADNASKGAELAEKLQGESELLWLTKRKLAEEKGRLAETKMTLPLMILLLVLIMVTITPALMEM